MVTSGGSFDAFPYGNAMWLTFYPFILITNFFGLPVELGFNFCILIADIVLLLSLQRLLPERQRLLLIAYWCSPIVILASYAYGLNDIVPALFLTLSIVFLSRYSLYLAGFFLAIAISAKLSMAMAAPFFAVYLYNNKV